MWLLAAAGGSYPSPFALMGHQPSRLPFDSSQLFLPGKKCNQHYLIRPVFAQQVLSKETADIWALALLCLLGPRDTLGGLLLQEASTDLCIWAQKRECSKTRAMFSFLFHLSARAAKEFCCLPSSLSGGFRGLRLVQFKGFLPFWKPQEHVGHRILSLELTDQTETPVLHNLLSCR